MTIKCLLKEELIIKVSIAVITYNSASTIIDTLDSIVKQDYGSENIELVISDDASTDNTVEVIHKWLDENSSLFLLASFLESSTNMGVSANINQAWKATSCEWIKSIAGDDILKKNCITKNVEYVSKNLNCKILFSKMQAFGATNIVIPTGYDVRFFDKSPKEQHNYLKLFSFNIAPSSFVFRDVLEHVGFANEKYKMIEDLPLWLKMTELGYKLQFMDEITVDYRVGESTTSSSNTHSNIPFLYDLISLYKDQMPSFSKNPFIRVAVLERVGYFYFQLAVSSAFENKINKYTVFLNKVSLIFTPISSSKNLLRKIYNSKNKA